MPVKCVTCGLWYRSGNELDWHVREEHTRPTLQASSRSPKGTAAPADAADTAGPAASPDPSDPPGPADPAATATGGLLAWLRRRLRPPDA